MIVSKNKDTDKEVDEVVIGSEDSNVELEGNPMADIYNAVAEILRDIRINPLDDNSQPLFKTIKLNTGQLARLKKKSKNLEDVIDFPAAFIHLINVRWLVSTARIGEGRADLRICYVLNRLNNGDDAYQTEGMEVFQRINTALTENKSKFSALTERLQLTYWDQVESFDDGLQQYWITYEVYFRDYSTYRYKNYKYINVVIPPFTNHSDQNPESNPNNHENHKVSINDAVSIAKVDSDTNT
jgi:hypothetical protein